MSPSTRLNSLCLFATGPLPSVQSISSVGSIAQISTGENMNLAYWNTRPGLGSSKAVDHGQCQGDLSHGIGASLYSCTLLGCSCSNWWVTAHGGWWFISPSTSYSQLQLSQPLHQHHQRCLLAQRSTGSPDTATWPATAPAITKATS